MSLRQPSSLAVTSKALKHHVTRRMAAAEAGTQYSTEWRILKKLEQTQVSNQRHIGPLSALENKAAYDLLRKLTADSTAVQLYNDGTVPTVIQKRLSSSPLNAMQRCWGLTFQRPPLEGVELNYQGQETGLRQCQYADRMEACAVH